MTYREEFPDFDPATMPTIPDGFVDQSWHNDSAPIFQNDALGIRVWIDYMDPELREIPESPRFGILTLAGVDICCTDDWADILKTISELELRENSTREQLGHWYKLMVGYDPTIDEPNMTDAELRDLCKSYLEEMKAERLGQ